MSTDEIKQQAATPHRHIQLVYALILGGLMVEMAVLGIGAWLGVQAGEYWGSTKAARDSAAVGDDLLVQIGRISAISTWLEPFRFVGLALFFAGIGVALSAIIPRIRLRAETMATVIPAIVQRARAAK